MAKLKIEEPDYAKTNDRSFAEFTFEEAVRMMERGKRMAREAWHTNGYVKLIDEKYIFNTEDADTVEMQFTREDQEASDWYFLA